MDACVVGGQYHSKTSSATGWRNSEKILVRDGMVTVENVVTAAPSIIVNAISLPPIADVYN